MKTKKNISTTTPPTWCPGCFNFQILAGFKKFLESEIVKGKKKDNFAIVTGIGCSGKMFDYINLNGLNTLHGREIPSALGIKLGNPNLDVYAFGGDGGTYGEGISHLIHAAKKNLDITFIVHNNQIFALTIGQPTVISEKGYSDKTTPEGVTEKPLNPLKLMLSSNAGFVARVFADVKQVEWVLKEAQKHKGFKFIEIIQPCIIFHPDKGYKEKTYMLNDKKHDSSNWKKAMEKAEEFDYELKENSKIPLGIFYKEKIETLEENLPSIRELIKKKKSWKDIKR
ncbi:MAG: thiamine pyrophosphate-dependent enzyme [Nanoarchaeota archaeon]|nr:thiamine pyrophosphate-dependent enzyme [Nanoarchaeota archaeon]